MVLLFKSFLTYFDWPCSQKVCGKFFFCLLFDLRQVIIHFLGLFPRSI